MAIKIEKSFQTPDPASEVWKILSDPRSVASCVPGAQVTEAVDDRTYKGVIKVKLGPTVTDYKGEAHIERLDDQSREIEMMGKGQDVRGKGSASMKMTGMVRELPAGGSEVVTISELNVVGILAQMGNRMIQEVANQVFEQFTKNLRQRLQQQASGAAGSGAPEEVKPIDAGSVAASAVLGLFKSKPKD
ncbi:MAG TPA: SRPBCC family protein [Chthoniobacterales bacterium]|nr:SRPBCC family protein [Chthoniobacterales bacterium]